MLHDYSLLLSNNHNSNILIWLSEVRVGLFDLALKLSSIVQKIVSCLFEAR